MSLLQHHGGAFGGGLAAARLAEEEIERDSDVSDEDDERVDFRENFESWEPLGVIETEGLEGAPEAVGDMEVDRDEPDDIDQAVVPLAELINQDFVGVSSFFTEEMLQLHFGPEVRQVQEEESDNEHAEDEHVFGGPVDFFGLSGDGVTHVARS